MLILLAQFYVVSFNFILNYLYLYDIGQLVYMYTLLEDNLLTTASFKDNYGIQFWIHSPNQTYLPKIQYIHRNRTERMKMTCLKILVYLMTMMTMMMKVLTMNSLPLQEWPVLVRVVLQPGVHLQKCCQKVCELFVSNLMLVYVCCLRKTAKCWKIHLCEIILYFKFHIKWFYFVTS